MKNIIFKSATLAVALAATITGCTNDEFTPATHQPEGKGITTITLGTPQSGPSTRLEYNIDDITNALGVKWRAGHWGDKTGTHEKALAVNTFFYGSYYGGVPSRIDEGGAASKAEFIFFTPDQTTSQGVSPGGLGILYPYKAAYSEAFNVNAGEEPIEATLPLTGQTGVLADMQDFDYMTGVTQVESQSETDKNIDLPLKHRIAVMRITGLTFPGLTSGNATAVTISGTGLKTDAKLTFTSDENDVLSQSLVLGTTEGPITTTGTFAIDTDGKMDDVYICFFPGNADATGTHEITNLKVTATVGSDTYEYSYTGNNLVTKFEEGKMYTLSGKAMTKQEAADYIQVGDLKWATGNLVADGANSCKIGTPTDGGLFFQFGSIIGWSATGTLAIAVSPVGYTNNTWNSTWVGNPATDNASTGTGDPCRYYLGDTWRLPTNEEYAALFKDHGYPTTGPWKWENNSATNATLGLTFPAAGYRSESKGKLADVGEYGAYWSASSANDTEGHGLVIFNLAVNPSNTFNRPIGHPVRCVK